jgi:hypothetical protein
MTCLQEHLTSLDDHVGCSGVHAKGKAFPKAKQVELQEDD